MEKMVLLGSGGHAKSVIDTIEQNGCYEIVGFLDTKEKQNYHYRGYAVIGTDDDLLRLYQEGVHHAFITIGYMGQASIRQTLYQRLKDAKYNIPTIIDASAQIATDASIGEGTFIGKQVIVNADTVIEHMCIINSGAIVEHDCRVAEQVHIAVGAVVCGGVMIGKAAFIGANATILQGKQIGQRAMVGAGSIITKDVEADSMIYNDIKPCIFKIGDRLR
ncbi:MAG: acetyltransferase [Lachnospiraceae bacterium]